MTKKLRILAPIGLFAAVGTLAFLLHSPVARANDLDLDGRFQTATVAPVSDPYFGDCLLLDATIGTSAPGDLTLDVLIWSQMTARPVQELLGAGVDSPLTDPGDPLTVRVRTEVDHLPPGDILTITATYMAPGGVVVDVESIQVLVP